MDATSDASTRASALYLGAFLLLYLSRKLNTQNRRKRRRFWVREIHRHRAIEGASATLMPRLRERDHETFFNFTRMTPETFEVLLSKVQASITKQDTRWRPAIPARTRLEMTIRFLASGDHQRSLSYAFRIGKSTTSAIISETCQAIWECLKDKFVRCPTNSEDWRRVAEQFETRWNFPHCIGAIDGKHVTTECPANTGSSNFNYKHSFSKVLMAVADAEYKFLYVSMGSSGSESDGGIFARSDIIQHLESSSLGLPAATPITDGTQLPYMMVGDEAFPLRTYLMRPYPKRRLTQHRQRVFNLRLSRARRVVENAFGIMCSRWRILRRPFKASEGNVNRYVLACVALHNFLTSEKESRASYCPPWYADRETSDGDLVLGGWREGSDAVSGLSSIGRVTTNTYSHSASSVRESLSRYFVDAGKLAWQDDAVLRGQF